MKGVGPSGTHFVMLAPTILATIIYSPMCVENLQPPKTLGILIVVVSFFVVNFKYLKVKISIRKFKILAFYISGRPVT